jgi:hypothetical protein
MASVSLSECGLENEFSNLVRTFHRHLLVLNDIQLTTIKGFSRNRVHSGWGRVYHGYAAEYRKQSEVEGTHVSVDVCCIVRRLNSEAERGTYKKRLASKLYIKVEKHKLGKV